MSVVCFCKATNLFLHLHEIVEWLYFHCSLSLCVCVSVCLCIRNSCEQNSSRTNAPIWTPFSLNGCLQHWLGPYWNWWSWVKGPVYRDEIPIFYTSTIFTYLNFYTSAKSWRGYIFTAVCLCVCLCVCLSVRVSVRLFLWTKFQPNGRIDLDAVFAK